MTARKFRGIRASDEVWNRLQAIQKARPRQFLTVEETIDELMTFYLKYHLNLAENVNAILEGRKTLDEVVVYHIRRKGPPPAKGEESPPPERYPPDEG